MKLDFDAECNYSNHIFIAPYTAMQKQSRTIDLKVVAIGNSRGIRLPKTVLDKYAITDTLVLEERAEGLLFRHKKKDKRLSWKDTYKEMSREREDWSDFDATIEDGLKDEAGSW